MTTRFQIQYSPELAQYVAVRGELHIVPTRRECDQDAMLARAEALCVALNRVYSAGAQNAQPKHHNDGSPRYDWGERPTMGEE